MCGQPPCACMCVRLFTDVKPSPLYVCVHVRACVCCVCVPHCTVCFSAVAATSGDNCVPAPAVQPGAAMVKCIKQNMGSQKSDGKGKEASGTQKIMLPLKEMQGRLLKGKGKMVNKPESSKKKNTGKGKMVEGKEKMTSKGQGKRMKMGSKKMRFTNKGKGKGGKAKFSKSKVPRSKVPGSKVPGSKVPGSKVPGSKVPEQKDIIYARSALPSKLIKLASSASKKGAQPRQGRQTR